MNQTKEVATRGSTSPAVMNQAASGILRTDILVPYIIMGQGQSDAVQEKKVQLGDIYRSTNAQILGNPDKPVEAIFLHYPKANWVIEQKTGSKFQYRKTIPRNASNETLEWGFWADNDGNEMKAGEKNATEWRRVKQLMVFALLPQDIKAQEEEMKKVELGEAPDPSKALTPVIFSFRSYGYKAGKEICTFFTQANSMNVPIWWYSIEAGNYLDKNDEGAFYVWHVDRNKSKAIPMAMRPVVEKWATLVGGQGADQLRADDQSDIDVSPAPAVAREVC